MKMVNSTKSVSYLCKSLLRLRLSRSKVNNNCINNEKSYSSLSQQNNNKPFNCNYCKNNKLIVDNGKKVRNHVLIRELRGSSYARPTRMKQQQDLIQLNDSEPIIDDLENSLASKAEPSFVEKPTEASIDVIEDDDNNESLDNKILMTKYRIPGPLETCNEDLSDFGPCMRPSFNFAAYANSSETIQQLVKLGVELYKIERYASSMKCILERNFEEIKVYIQFLHDCGVQPNDIGRCLTKFPRIVEEDLDDLLTRIRYMRAHKFSIEDIQRIVTVCPQWLRYPTKEVDKKLGYFQAELKLTGDQVRSAFVTQPKLIIAGRDQLRENFFSFKEEMEFSEDQIKQILLLKPSIFINDRQLVTKTFEYVYNKMEISHELLAVKPTILLTPVSKTAERHEFLKLLKRNQYDPSKPLYVNLDDFSRSSDYEFCSNIAKTSIQLFDMFLKTR